MQLAHLKTSPVVVLGPLELLEWPNETFALIKHHQFSLTLAYLSLEWPNETFAFGQHHQFCVTKEPMSLMY